MTGGMARELIAHRWTCPICSETKTSLATMDAVEAEEQAMNALASHVRTRDGGGHGSGGRFPPDLDVDSLRDHIHSDAGHLPSGRTQ